MHTWTLTTELHVHLGPFAKYSMELGFLSASSILLTTSLPILALQLPARGNPPASTV